MPFHAGLRARPIALAMVVAAAASMLPSAARADALNLPRGFRVTRVHAVSPGVVHLRIQGRHQRIQVARITPDSGARPLVAVARGAVTTGKQRTSQMCSRMDCLVGVNGDFYYSSGRPAGAVVIGREPWITRRYDRPHLVITNEGSYRVSRISIPLKVKVRYPNELEPVDQLAGTDIADDRVQEMVADGLNTPRESGSLIVYTRRRGDQTGTGAKGVELTGTIVSKPKRLLLRDSATVQITGLRERGNAPIARDGVVLSGRGTHAKALRALWRDIREGAARPSIRVQVGGPKDAAQVLGGRPELVRDGKVLKQDDDWFSRASLARSIVGWTGDGTLYIVTIDGAGGARGMSLTRAARFMRALGVTGALNLDGGGSTTFVKRGNVANRPRWGGERAVATALLVVRETPAQPSGSSAAT